MSGKEAKWKGGGEKDEFRRHLERASGIVDGWPEWKQTIMTKTSMTAQMRNGKDKKD